MAEYRQTIGEEKEGLRLLEMRGRVRSEKIENERKREGKMQEEKKRKANDWQRYG